MVIPIEVDLIFKMEYKLRGKKEQEEQWRGWGESVCFKGRDRHGASNGDRDFLKSILLIIEDLEGPLVHQSC